MNPYVNLYTETADQRLYEELVHEAIQFSGIDALYMPRSSQSRFDALFGDDPTKMFKQAYPVEVFIDSVDQFEGGELFSKFGIEVRKQARFIVSNRAFQMAMPAGFGRPLEGDILWLRNFQAFLEIKYVEDENMFYTFGGNNTGAGLYGFGLVCEKWIMAEEVVSTGVSDLDAKANEVVTAYNYIMSSANSAGTYIIGEKVSFGSTFGTVQAWNLPSLTLSLKHVSGAILANNVLVGQNSAASFTVASAITRQNVNQPLDNNQLVSVQGSNGIVDFQESNPFGSPVFP